MKRLEADVKEFVDAHRAELDGKSRALVFGKVGISIFQQADAGSRESGRSDCGLEGAGT